MILASQITYFQAIVLGLVQGVTELFPISSLGTSVVLPKLFGWDIHQNDAYFLTFLVATHLATAIVLLVFFWRDWVRIVNGIGRSLRDRGIAEDDGRDDDGWMPRVQRRVSARVDTAANSTDVPGGARRSFSFRS